MFVIIRLYLKKEGLYMDKKTRKWGDRRDAVWLKDIPAMNRIMPSLMPNRADNEAFVSVEIDIRPMNEYLAKKNEGRTEDKYTWFHLIAAAACKAFVLRPKMNRFVCNNKVYQRNDVTVAFTVKKKFNDHAEEGLAFMKFDPKDTIDTFHDKLMKIIHHTKREDATDASSGVMDLICKLPQWLVVTIVKLVRWLDKFGLAPQDVIATDPNHAAVFLSNLGSIGLECGYHHLVNWGTNSCFIVVGKKKWTMTYGPDGASDPHEIIPIGITLDERIADGYYYSGTVALVKELLEHPELLEMSADTPVEYAIKK